MINQKFKNCPDIVRTKLKNCPDKNLLDKLASLATSSFINCQVLLQSPSAD